MDTTIDRRSGLTREEFVREYALKGRPVVLTDATDSWAARTRWTFDFFRERCGDVRVKVSPALHVDEVPVEMTMAEYLDSFRKASGRPMYLTSWRFPEHCPELVEDFQPPAAICPESWLELLAEGLRPGLLWIFMGPRGSGFRLHVDVGHTGAWNAQVVGRKRWLLFPPEQVGLLYDGDVDGFEPDLSRFPRFGAARPIDFVLEPGEVVYVPSLWWHQTRHLDDGIAVTANFVDETNYGEVMRWLSGRGEAALLEGVAAAARARGRPLPRWYAPGEKPASRGS